MISKFAADPWAGLVSYKLIKVRRVLHEGRHHPRTPIGIDVDLGSVLKQPVCPGGYGFLNLVFEPGIVLATLRTG